VRTKHAAVKTILETKQFLSFMGVILLALAAGLRHPRAKRLFLRHP
jgi:hypothetical protein